MRRVVVIGCSGSGKSTLARELARRLNVPHIELDAIHWKPNWVSTPPDQMRPIVDRLTSEPAWVCDGNYSKMRDAVWPKADTLIWLDYQMGVVMSRVFRRTVLRSWRQEQLWNGNRERLWDNLLTRNSLFLWVIGTWRLYRRDYPRLLKSPAYCHLRVFRFRSPAQLERWKRQQLISQPV